MSRSKQIARCGDKLLSELVFFLGTGFALVVIGVPPLFLPDQQSRIVLTAVSIAVLAVIIAALHFFVFFVPLDRVRHAIRKATSVLEEHTQQVTQITVPSTLPSRWRDTLDPPVEEQSLSCSSSHFASSMPQRDPERVAPVLDASAGVAEEVTVITEVLKSVVSSMHSRPSVAWQVQRTTPTRDLVKQQAAVEGLLLSIDTAHRVEVEKLGRIVCLAEQLAARVGALHAEDGPGGEMAVHGHGNRLGPSMSCSASRYVSSSQPGRDGLTTRRVFGGDGSLRERNGTNSDYCGKSGTLLPLQAPFFEPIGTVSSSSSGSGSGGGKAPCSELLRAQHQLDGEDMALAENAGTLHSFPTSGHVKEMPSVAAMGLSSSEAYEVALIASSRDPVPGDARCDLGDTRTLVTNTTATPDITAMPNGHAVVEKDEETVAVAVDQPPGCPSPMVIPLHTPIRHNPLARVHLNREPRFSGDVANTFFIVFSRRHEGTLEPPCEGVSTQRDGALEWGLSFCTSITTFADVQPTAEGGGRMAQVPFDVVDSPPPSDGKQLLVAERRKKFGFQSCVVEPPLRVEAVAQAGASVPSHSFICSWAPLPRRPMRLCAMSVVLNGQPEETVPVLEMMINKVFCIAESAEVITAGLGDGSSAPPKRALLLRGQCIEDGLDDIRLNMPVTELVPLL